MNFKDLKNMDKNAVLETLGFETHAIELLPAIGLVGVGLLVGVGIGMLFAPKAGYELRDDVRTKVQNLRTKTNGGDVLGETPIVPRS